MTNQFLSNNPILNQTLNEFRQYLTVRKDRDEATGEAYCYDVIVYADYFLNNVSKDIVDFSITPECIIGFSDYLKRKINPKTNNKLSRSTIKRRLIGVYNYWKFLYREKKIENPPVSLDDLDIIIKKTINPTEPLNPQNFASLRKALKDELLSKHN